MEEEEEEEEEEGGGGGGGEEGGGGGEEEGGEEGEKEEEEDLASRTSDVRRSRYDLPSYIVPSFGQSCYNKIREQRFKDVQNSEGR